MPEVCESRAQTPRDRGGMLLADLASPYFLLRIRAGDIHSLCSSDFPS